MRNTAEAEVVAGGPSSGATCLLSGIHDDFAKFRSQHALLKAHMPRAEVDWAYYQAGPTASNDPLVFLHSTSGTAASFFYQVQMLAAKGYRVISAQYPGYSTPEEWCKGFDTLLDMLKCRSAHVFGAGLGGYLVQYYAAMHPQRIRSLVLCNAFASTRPFAESAGALASVVYITPTPILKRVILDSFPDVPMTLQVKQAVDFVAGQVDSISGTDLAGRLSLNSTDGCAPPLPLDFDDSRITIIESNGETMVPEELRRELRRRYSSVRVAQLKTDGDFPFLSDPDDVSLYVEVHLRGLGCFTGPSSSAPSAVTRSEEDPVQQEQRQEAAAAVDAPVRQAPPRRPKWVNPFEDDPML